MMPVCSAYEESTDFEICTPIVMKSIASHPKNPPMQPNLMAVIDFASTGTCSAVCSDHPKYLGNRPKSSGSVNEQYMTINVVV